ncbi:MAG: serine O-acetyltransferase [Syntrophus sp. SKADARSKE-3]|nr:serine O-acetyltransferase [Syntrophus sp. SKADARSKE-3]
MKNRSEKAKCKTHVDVKHRFREEIPAIVEQLVTTCNNEGCFDHVSAEPIPRREIVIDIFRRTGRILYPGYFIPTRLDEVNVGYYLGQEMTALFEVLSGQISLAIRHDCIRHNLSCSHCEEQGQKEAVEFLKSLPEMREMLAKDIRAAYEGDPAANGYDDIIFSYPGLFAITVYRIAHQLHGMGIPLIPRIMSEYAHSHTGIDIHPGARIGESFFIDHGTGVVIGETTIIGDRVRIYQGVTLGALSLSREECAALRKTKRHPTIEDDVIIYANATVLGGDTVIGARSVIGGNVWITHSIMADTEVFIKKQDLVFGEKRYKDLSRKKAIAGGNKT